MSDTATRALSLLNLLQTHRHWPGSELASRLGVTERTVRRDIDRLRELGYRIESVPGASGGYRLEAGSAVPPLLLTDDEAVAMAIGLRVAASQRLVSGPETTITALAKLEQVLPAPLRRRVTALADTVQPAGLHAGAAVSSEVLCELALACRDAERVRFTYTAASGEVTRRRVEPHALAPADRHWYLLCWDLDRDDWRTFRVDRLADVEHTRVLFARRPLTAEEVEEFILVARSWVRQPVEADAVMDLPFDEMRAAFGQWGQGATAEDDHRTRWPVGGGDFRETMYGLSWIPAGVEYTTDLAEPFREELRETLQRMLRALDAEPPQARAAHRRSAGA
jgi:predicted DNA-binding transcriptional regulator YafY